MLEASDAKVSSTVLRVLGDRKVAWLLADLPLTIRRDSSTDGQTGIYGSPLRRQRTRLKDHV